MATFDYRDFVWKCKECGERTYFYRFNEETKMEEYRCKAGHTTEKPENTREVKGRKGS